MINMAPDELLVKLPDGGYVISYLPAIVDRSFLDVILAVLAEAGADDVFISTDNPLCAKINGSIHRLSARFLGYGEVSNLLAEIHQPSTPGRVASEDVDFSYTVPVNEIKSWRFRCNATGTMGTMGSNQGIGITMRSIPGCPLTMDELKVPQALRDMVFPESGIVIVTGPTGSGKTTLLSSFIRHAATMPSGKRIISYESPPEYDYHAIPDQTGLIETSQVGVGGHLRSFALAVRNSLRRNPSIILCGESRDRETIEGAIEASQTGHLVFTTSHTNQVAPTISRMANIFTEGDRHKITDALKSTVRVIIHQRLLRKPGGQGRTPILEWLEFDQSVRDILYRCPDSQLVPTIDNLVKERGRHLGYDLVEKFEQGLISQEDFYSVLQELKTDGP